MKLIEHDLFFKNLPVGKEQFPYFYTEEYQHILQKTENKKSIIIHDTTGTNIACRVWKNKFLVNLQPMYPPLSLTGQRLDITEESKFLNKFVSFAKKMKIARITQPDNFALFQCVPKNSVNTPFGSYTMNLENFTEEALFAKLHSKHRNVIRNAEKHGVVLKYGIEVIDDFYLLYQQTMERSAMYCNDISYFKEFFNFLPQNTLCGVCYYNNIPQGGLFIPFSNFGSFYLYGASAESKGINGSINYLHWNTIKLLKEKGVKRYDFAGARLSDISGTKLEGIQQFKERFGSALENGFLWKKDLNKFNCLVFDLLMYLKHKLNDLTPSKDIIDQELLKDQSIREKSTNYSIQNRFKNQLRSKQQKLKKGIRRYKKKIDKNQLAKNIAISGIQKGDTIIVHSSLSKIGNVKDGSKTIIRVLLEQIGPEGNLAFPAYTYINSMLNTSKETDYIFIPSSTPSVVGIISEEFRKLPLVKRSIHPTHSVCVLGPNAEEITEGHFKAGTNFGPNTPFHKLRSLKGKIVGLGITIGPVTIYHSVEDFYPELFRGVYLPKPTLIKVKINEKTIEKKIFIHNPSFHINRIDKNKNIEVWMHNHFKEKGILHESSFGESIIWWMDIQELFDELLELQKKGISIYKVPEN